MTDRPILMSAPMVRALLDSRKTQTRQVTFCDCECVKKLGGSPYCNLCGGAGWKPTIWQSVKPGDRLWVREAFVMETPIMGIGKRPFYRADDPPDSTSKYKPSIHMPRWASRLTLVVTATKMERVQEISEDDARAEGAVPVENGWSYEPGNIRLCGSSAPGAYYCLWQSLHTKPGERWEDNPEVVALTFTPHQCNIDAMDNAHGSAA